MRRDDTFDTCWLIFTISTFQLFALMMSYLQYLIWDFIAVGWNLFPEYFGEDGPAFELPLVRKLKQQIQVDPTLHPESPSCFGLPEFSKRATEFALGRSLKAVIENRVISVTIRFPINRDGLSQMAYVPHRTLLCSTHLLSG